MMASRNPKVAPKKAKPKPRESTLSKEQAWTDTDDTETTKESGETTEQTQDISDQEEPQKGSIISVKEAAEADKDDPLEGPSDMETNGVTNNGYGDYPMTTDTEVPNGTETDSVRSIESATRRKVKRNTVVPTDEEVESGRQSPDSETRKDAWSAHEADISESDAPPSRPSSAAALYRQALTKQKPRPATAPGKKSQITPVERPMTAPTSAIASRSRTRPGSSSPAESSGSSAEAPSARPGTSGSRPRSREQRNSPNPLSKPLGITNGEISEVSDSPVESTFNGVDNRAMSRVSSCDLLAPPKANGEQSAYIPIYYARESIQKVMDDMKRMKASHVKVIDRIQDQYKLIEDEIQGNFNTFVLSLRTQYSSKVSTFRHVIEIHREDTLRKQEYWQNTAKSLQSKNKTLMQEKRQLMVKNRDEFTRLEEEKEKTVKDLTTMLDDRHAKYTAMLKDLKNERNKVIELEEKLRALEAQREKQQAESDSNKNTYEQELIVIRTKHEEELKETKEKMEELEKEKEENAERLTKEQVDEERNKLTEVNEKFAADLESKDAEIKRLQEELERLRAGGVGVEVGIVAATAAVTSATPEVETAKEERQKEVKEQAEGVQSTTKVVTVTETVIDSKELARLREERDKLNEEKTKLSQEFDKFKEECDKHREELDQEKDKVMKLEEDSSHLGKERARFEKQATESKQEVRELRQQSAALREQLQGLLLATAASADDKETEEKLKAAEAEKQSLEEEQAKMKEEFEKWKEQYQAEHEGEEPDEDDRSEEIQQLMEKLKEEEEKLKKAESTVVVMTMLKEGQVPETLPAAAVSVSNERLEELEDRISKLEEERDDLEVKLETAKKESENEVEKLSNENDSLKETTSSLEDTIEQLKSEMEDLKAELEEARDAVVEPSPTPGVAMEGEDLGGMSEKFVVLQEELDKASEELDKEKAETATKVDEIESLKQELANIKEGSSSEGDELRAELKSTKERLEAEIDAKEKALEEAKKRVEELEQQLMANVPVDTAKELKAYKEKISALEKAKDKLAKENLAQKATTTTLGAKVETLTNNLERQKKTEAELQESNRKMRIEKDKEVKEAKERADTKSKQKIDDNNKMIQTLQKRIKELESGATTSGSKIDTGLGAKRKDSRAVDPEKLAKEKEKLQAQIDALKKAAQEDSKKIKALEKEARDAQKNAKPAGPSAEDRAAAKKMDKQLKDATKNLEMEKKKCEKAKDSLAKTEEELKDLTKEHDALMAESKKDKADLAKLDVAAKEGLAAQEKVDELTKEVKALREENKTLSDNYNSERILRKKYYNMVEDMKGKIRVYCRARPLSKSELGRGNFSVIKSPDEYSIVVTTARGPRDFQFDQVFFPEHGQEKVFEDTHNLIQSAVDGYNVCIFAYGQTGSGKTFTMIGDKERNFPGIAPRAMENIYNLLNENKKKFSFKVYVYMMELYNDKLIDLLTTGHQENAKLDIKKDKKGMVFVQGSIILESHNKEELWTIFERGSENRHVASTKMNAESSRSHLILGIIIESTNLTSGAVTKGKLSLVDLAGSERAAKTDASAEQLKEAQSINKSLSALGDVISALSSDQQFIPYRNNKLTMLMQDSLGGNAKTLMFVNISPADYNTDETVTSLTYASRVKLITNDAQKNSDNKEITRLKGVIAKLKKGEAVEVDDD